jgi:hypothetical protein
MIFVEDCLRGGRYGRLIPCGRLPSAVHRIYRRPLVRQPGGGATLFGHLRRPPYQPGHRANAEITHAAP